MASRVGDSDLTLSMGKLVTIEYFARPENEAWTPRPFDHSVYLAFQGGGARGVSHVGGLAAVEELRLTIKGVAGTSAGAILAALVAAKFESKDLLNPSERTHLLQKVANGKYEKATSLFSESGWKSIKGLRESAKSTSWLARAIRHKWKTLGALCAVLCLLPNPPLLGIAIILLGYWTYRRLRRIHDGLASLQSVRDLVNTAIAERLNLDGTSPITFEQMKKAGGRPLKLVATNVTNKSLELFSVETTPQVAVADAVAASICLPFIFEPWSVAFEKAGDNGAVARRFLDGGLMSNLPAWSFDEERALDPKAVTIAFGLKARERQAHVSASEGAESATSEGAGANERSPENGAAEDAAREETPQHWFLAALDTIVAGPPEIHFRGIDRLVQVQLQSSITMLDFDAPFDTLSNDVSKARVKAVLELERELTTAPKEFRGYLDRMRIEVSNGLIAGFPGLGSLETPFFRVTLAIQRVTDRYSMTIAYEVGHRLPTIRRRLSLDRSTMAGRAWADGSTEKVAIPMMRGGDLVYQDSAWAAAVPVPVFQPEEEEAQRARLAVVAIFDSPTPLPANMVINSAHTMLFYQELYSFASVYFTLDDFGRMCRETATWL